MALGLNAFNNVEETADDEQWSLMSVGVLDDASDHVAEHLDEEDWSAYTYDDDLVRAIYFSMESDGHSEIDGMVFFIPVTSEGNKEDSKLIQCTEILPEMMPKDLSIKIIRVCKFVLTYETITVSAEQSYTMYYGIQNDAVISQYIDGLVDNYLEGDDNVASALLEDSIEMFDGLV